MNAIEISFPAASVSMADEWFEVATADHFWMQWRHRLLRSGVQRAGDEVRHALDVGAAMVSPGKC